MTDCSAAPSATLCQTPRSTRNSTLVTRSLSRRPSQKELEGVANPIMMKFYGAGGEGGGMPGGMPGGGMPGGAPGGPGGDDGPTVEEVD
jgi:hypothetical protein